MCVIPPTFPLTGLELLILKMEEDIIEKSLQQLEDDVDIAIYDRDDTLESMAETMSKLSKEEKELEDLYSLYIKRLHGGKEPAQLVCET